VLYIASVIKETYPFLPKRRGNKLSRTMFPRSPPLSLLRLPQITPVPPAHFFYPAAKLTLRKKEKERKRERRERRESTKEGKGKGIFFERERARGTVRKREGEGRREKADRLRARVMARDERTVRSL